jgi:hypothetical protein
VRTEAVLNDDGGERVARIEVRLEQAVAQQADHESRVRRLERALWTAVGFAAAFGGLIGAAVAKFIGIAA